MAVVDKIKADEDSIIRRFCKIVLGWDIFRLQAESDKKNKDAVKAKELSLKRVKNTYKDVDEYIATFEPLLFEEVKAQIVQGLRRDPDEEEEEGEVREWKRGVIKEFSEAGDFYFPSIVHDTQKETISQNDLLLLSKTEFKDGTELPRAYAFALVENRDKREGLQSVRLRMFLAGEVMKTNIDELESRPRLLNMRQLITQPGTMLYMLKMCSLSTILREYIALRSVDTLPFKDLILKASGSDSSAKDREWRIPDPLVEFIKTSHNQSQQEAIHEGLSSKAFILIQGPPGTGKTQTILGLLSAILHASPARVQSRGGLRESGPELPLEKKYHHWSLASPWLSGVNPRDELPTDAGEFVIPGNEFKPEVDSRRKGRVRVLVCAPSNSALDEIVLRILSIGIRDENDHAYNPKIVRIGLKPHHSVEMVSMDNIVEQKRKELSSGKQKGLSDVDSIRARILDEAAIVFSTLSFSGSTLFSKLNCGFDVVIIDEAAQAVEPATLIPLVHGCKKVFLIGDPEQLPATVISSSAIKFGYGMSLFKRFQSAGYPVQMLKTQYRMHPEIRSFPSKEFYSEALEDGPEVISQTTRPWHRFRCFGPFCFFDIHEGKESQPAGSGSMVNVDEIDFVLMLYQTLVAKFPELKSSSRLAIISPYRHQVKMFRERLRDIYSAESAKSVDINTVDGFQGREKDVAIFSCVRASKDGGIGFLSDFRRMNVGITRAKSAVLVVGSASTLKRDEHWKNLVESAEKRNCIFKVSKPYEAFFSDQNMASMLVSDQQMPERMETQLDGMDYEAPMAVDGDQGQAEENEYGDGEGYADDGGGDDGGD